MTGPEGFVLELLPARGLDQSMLLPVLIGLFVVLFFTETLGWVFAGAVVPGYLASVLIIQPVTGAIVIFESLITLALAAGLARGLSETDAWTRFFGRERFFLILAISLIVRVHDHAWLAPWVIGRLDAELGTTLETQQEFYSVGLVLVPLTANMLWKPAVHRGLLQLGVQVGLTYVIVLHVLLPYTNLTLSGVELFYEDAALNFVGHAKAHIILLTAALLAAQFNLSYGWDFNGILVPALLAMLWLTPLKLIATIGEAIVVLTLVRWFLRAPVIRHLDFEGPRKITLVFTLAFVWKLALGFTLAPMFPELAIRDTYGFGYLLSSLLAVKMLGRKSVRAILLPSLTASAGGFMLGSVAGFLLEIAAPNLPEAEPITQSSSGRLVQTPLGVMALARMQISTEREPSRTPSQAELHQLQRLWAELARLDRPDPVELERLSRRAATLGLQIVSLGDHPAVVWGESRTWWAIVEHEPQLGLPTALLIPGATGPVLVVPLPASEAPVAEAAAVACRRLDCRAVLVAGRERPNRAGDLDPRPLELALAGFASAPIVVLRANAIEHPRSVPAALDRSLTTAGHRSSEVASSERVRTKIHPLRGHVDLSAVWPDHALDWRPIEPGLRAPAGDGEFVLVRTTPADLEALLLDGADELLGPDTRLDTRGHHDSRELLDVLARIHAPPEPDDVIRSRYDSPSTAELSLLEQDIVEPLVEWARTSRQGIAPPPTVAIWAALLDYELVEFGDCEAVQAEPRACMILLREHERARSTGWGTLVVRRGPQTLHATIEVPRPQRESETWRIGAELWQLSHASALLIAGVDALARDASHDQSPDPVQPGNLDTAFQAFHQAIDRGSIRGRAREVVQIRGLAASRDLDRDVILGLGQPGAAGQLDRGCWTNLDPRLAVLVERLGRCQVADGSAGLYALSGAGSPQLEYSRELRNREVRVLWLSAGLRDRFRVRSGLQELRGLRQVGFEPVAIDELELLLAPLQPASPEPSGSTCDALGFERALALGQAFARTGNLHDLRELRALDDDCVDVRVVAGIGEVWGRPFLAVTWLGRSGARAWIALDHTLDGEVVLTADELRHDPVARLQLAALGRPSTLVLRPLELPRNGGRP